MATQCGRVMKMTMHIDETLLERVVREGGFKTKTEAVAAGLRELDRKRRFADFVQNSITLRFTPEELAASVAGGHDILKMRNDNISPYYQESLSLVAEEGPRTPGHLHP